MRSQLIMAVVVEAFDGGFFDRSVHPLDLAVGPEMVGLREPMLNAVGFADHVEAHGLGVGSISVSGLLCELDAVVSEDGVDLIGHCFEHVLQELPSRLPVCLLDQLGYGKLACAIDAEEQVELSFSSLHLGSVDVEEADRIALELRPLRLVARHVG